MVFHFKKGDPYKRKCCEFSLNLCGEKCRGHLVYYSIWCTQHVLQRKWFNSRRVDLQHIREKHGQPNDIILSFCLLKVVNKIHISPFIVYPLGTSFT